MNKSPCELYHIIWKKSRKVNGMYRTDNPIRDFENYDRAQAQALKKYPVCCECGEPIQGDYLYDIGGELYCPECMEMKTQYVDKYIREAV